MVAPRRSKEERIRLYNEANRLASLGFTTSNISHSLPISRGMAYEYIARHHRPKHETLVPDPLDSPSPAYLAGFYVGDGRNSGMERNVRFKLADKEQVEYVSVLLAQILGTAPKQVLSEEGFYMVRYTNSILHDFLHQPLDSLIRAIQSNKKRFLRGLFDTEGYVGLSPTERRVKVVVGLATPTSICSRKSKKFLKFVTRQLSVEPAGKAERCAYEGRSSGGGMMYIT